MLSQVVELIENNGFFGITTHSRPDGDGVGSSLGLWWLLTSLGKRAEIIVRDPIPPAYRGLPGALEIRVVDDIDREYDAVFVIECSDMTRPGLPSLCKQKVVNIDHHATSELFGHVNWIDATASAVGEMVYNLCKAIGGRISHEIAECVYTALVTDTGSFHYSNTTERTFKVASELIRVGVKPAKVSEAVYNSYSWSRVELLSKIMPTIRRDLTGKVASMRQTLAMVDDAESVDGDNNGFVNLPMVAKEIEAVVFMKETRKRDYRVSFRSKGDIDVAKIAEKFGGGGHKNAAGCRVAGNWDELEAMFVKTLAEVIEKSKKIDEVFDEESELALV